MPNVNDDASLHELETNKEPKQRSSNGRADDKYRGFQHMGSFFKTKYQRRARDQGDALVILTAAGPTGASTASLKSRLKLFKRNGRLSRKTRRPSLVKMAAGLFPNMASSKASSQKSRMFKGME